MSSILFIQLVESLVFFKPDQSSSLGFGALNAFESTIHLLYALTQSNPEFLKLIIQGNTLDVALLPVIRERVKYSYEDYIYEHGSLLTIDEYIEQVFLKSKTHSDDYYYGNGCYDMSSITNCLLVKLVNASRK